jgi:hypothetical protein
MSHPVFFRKFFDNSHGHAKPFSVFFGIIDHCLTCVFEMTGSDFGGATNDDGFCGNVMQCSKKQCERLCP